MLKENIIIPVDSGKINLRGSIYYSESTLSKAPWVLNLAGLLDHRESFFVKFYTEKFAEAGYYVLSYDHRAHGETSEQTGKNWIKHLNEIFNDLPRVISWVLENQSHRLLDEKIVLFGRSLGGAIILTQCFLDKRAKILIPLCTRFDYTKFKIKFPDETIRHVSAKYFLKEDPSNNSRILTGHCRDDPRIPFENIIKIKNQLGLSDENVLIYEDGGHAFKGHRDDIFEQSIKFLNKFL